MHTKGLLERVVEGSPTSMAWSAGLKSRASTNAAQGQPSNEAATSVVKSPLLVTTRVVFGVPLTLSL